MLEIMWLGGFFSPYLQYYSTEINDFLVSFVFNIHNSNSINSLLTFPLTLKGTAAALDIDS